MSLIYQHHKKNDTIYVYESQSYWCSDLKQSRSRRKLIGKIDKETGEIVPTGKSGRKKKVTNIDSRLPSSSDNNSSDTINYKILYQQSAAKVEEQGKLIVELKAENGKLSAKIASYQDAVNKVQQVIDHL